MNTQSHTDALVESVLIDTLTSDGVKEFMVRNFPVNGRSRGGITALDCAVYCKRRHLVVALVWAGADTNMKDMYGGNSVMGCAERGTADILRVLIDGGASINEADNFGRAPLIALVSNYDDDHVARLGVMLACSYLDLDVKFRGKTAGEWATGRMGVCTKAMIMHERMKRSRWSVLRFSWIASTVTATSFVAF
jgi:hypothetical protein